MYLRYSIMTFSYTIQLQLNGFPRYNKIDTEYDLPV